MSLESFEPAQLRDEVEGSFARRMLHIYRAFNSLAATKYAQRGYQGLTTAHTSLMANLEIGGIRIVDLALRMGITKQFAGRLVQELAKVDYVTTTPDATDRRATLVKGTAAGWQFLLDACEVRAEIEDTFKAVLDEQQLGAFVEALEKLASLKIDTTGEPELMET